jgi:hypothetical protein
LAFLSGVSGGKLLDLLIGAKSIPFYYVKDIVFPLGILLVALISKLIVAIYKDAPQSEAFKKNQKICRYSGILHTCHYRGND